jgi:exosortase A-associated hydrolase 1
MGVDRKPVVSECRGEQLVGILDLPENCRERGVLVVTGGPQYRVGSHRQFVDVARHIASHGHPVMRFDYRGMGDSGGELQDFRSCLPDIRAAIDTFVAEARVEEVVIWGLCDAASAGLIYAPDDARVAGLVLLNPWVRTDEGLARAYVKHYYLKRIFAKDFWAKLASGEVSLGKSLSEFGANIRSAMTRSREDTADDRHGDEAPVHNFRQRMQRGLARFDGPILLILCGGDLTAAEFIDYTRATKPWPRLIHKATRRDLPGADHTFSTETWREQVVRWTTEWLSSW